MTREHMERELAKKLDPAHVKGRKQGGANVQYIEGWHAIAEANAIFGHFGWTRETVDLRCVTERERLIGEKQKPGWGVTYTAKVRVIADGVPREGVGAGHGIGVDLGECHESAIKEAETDAMKRALSTWGWRFGLALYDKKRENVGVEPPEVSDDAIGEATVYLEQADTLDDLRARWGRIPAPVQANAQVLKVKEFLKNALTAKKQLAGITEPN